MRACKLVSFSPSIQFHDAFQLSDLMRLLYDEAIKQGVKFRLGTTAISIDPEQGEITMDSGDVLQADVIVGADGIAGLSRQILLQEEDIDEPADHQSMWMYR